MDYVKAPQNPYASPEPVMEETAAVVLSAPERDGLRLTARGLAWVVAGWCVLAAGVAVGAVMEYRGLRWSLSLMSLSGLTAVALHFAGIWGCMRVPVRLLKDARELIWGSFGWYAVAVVGGGMLAAPLPYRVRPLLLLVVVFAGVFSVGLWYTYLWRLAKSIKCLVVPMLIRAAVAALAGCILAYLFFGCTIHYTLPYHDRAFSPTEVMIIYLNSIALFAAVMLSACVFLLHLGLLLVTVYRLVCVLRKSKGD